MLEVGERLSERYKIEGILGQGGMGAVYMATMESLGGKRVAIKEMELQETVDRDAEEAVEQFRKEATFLAHLDHPNLVKVTDFFSQGNKHYLVMDYVEGETLQQAIERRQKPFEWSELKPIARSLVKVLQYLHGREPAILFRDLKPANIMVDKQGRMKLIDFGIARTANPGMETSSFLKGTGTNGFSPIEQYGVGETTDERSDIYAFGATLYYLMTGKLPPNAVTRVSMGRSMEPASKFNPKLPRGMDEVLARCLEVRQDKRYSSMRELAKNLGRLGSGAQVVDHVPTQIPDTETIDVVPSSQAEVRASAPWAAALAVMAVACLATASLFTYNVGKMVTGETPESKSGAETTQREEVSPSESGSRMTSGSIPNEYQPQPAPQIIKLAPSETKSNPVRVQKPAEQPRPKIASKPKPKPKKKKSLSLGQQKYPTYKKSNRKQIPTRKLVRPGQFQHPRRSSNQRYIY